MQANEQLKSPRLRGVKPCKNNRFPMPDGEFLQCCVMYSVNRVHQSSSFVEEVYRIIDCNLAHFRIQQIHGDAVNADVRQDCALKIFAKTIPKMVASVPASGRLNAHSYIFQAAYYEVGQFIRKYTRRKSLGYDPDELANLIGRLVFGDGGKVVTKD